MRAFAALLRADGVRTQVPGNDVLTHAAGVCRVVGLTGQYAMLDGYLSGQPP